MLENMVNNTGNLFLNASVVGALILSMVYHMPLAGLEPSVEATTLFGGVTHWVEWGFLISAYFTMLLAWALLIISLRYYLILNFWMVSTLTFTFPCSQLL